MERGWADSCRDQQASSSHPIRAHELKGPCVSDARLVSKEKCNEAHNTCTSEPLSGASSQLASVLGIGVGRGLELACTELATRKATELMSR